MVSGKFICGQRGGLAWKDVKRPDYKNGLCPTGTTPCSSSTTLQYTTCYAPADHEANCPITDLQFVTGAMPVFSAPLDYQVVSTGSTDHIATSKQANGLPLTDTTLEFQPCMKPGFKSIDPNPKLIYPLEMDRTNLCVVDKTTG